MTVSGVEEPAGQEPEQVDIPPDQMPIPGLLPPGTMHLQLSAHQGPLPPPQVVGGYEQVHPGAAAWILREAEASAAHTRDMERRALKYQARDALLHRILPFILVALLLIISAILAIFANPYLGGAAFFGTLASVVTVYLKGSMPAK